MEGNRSKDYYNNVARFENREQRLGFADIERLMSENGITADNCDVILLDGVELSDPESSSSLPIENLEGEHLLSDRLVKYLGQRVLVVSRSRMVEELTQVQQASDIIGINQLNLQADRALATHSIPGKNSNEAVKMVETYGEFPRLFKEYLVKMERLKSLLGLIRQTKNIPSKKSLNEALLQELRETISEYEDKTIEIATLPRMSFQDLKLNLAGIIANAKHEKEVVGNEDISVIIDRLRLLRQFFDKKHEFSLAIDDIDPELQSKIDQNNLILAIIETELRNSITEQLYNVIGQHPEGFVVLGSAAWGPYYEVKESSDVDTEIIFTDEQFKEFYRQLDVQKIDSLPDDQLEHLLSSGEGQLFNTIRALVDAGYAVGKEKIDKIRGALKQFAVFAELRLLKKDSSNIDDQTGYQRPAKIGQNFADYMSFKVNMNGVDVSVHILASESYIDGCSLDLNNSDETQTMNEIRVGARKKVSSAQKEKTSMDMTFYPDKSSFDGQKINYQCEVSALTRDAKGGYVLYRPSQLSDLGIEDKAVLAWVTATPTVVVENGKMYHGLFQDKTLWGKLDQNSSPELKQAHELLFTRLINRFIAEVKQGLITDKKGSLLQLTSRFERIPAYTKRRMLLQIQRQSPQLFAEYSQVLSQLGSNELEQFGIVNI